MRNKVPLIIVLGLLLINLVSNSCKKQNETTISSLFSDGSWQLASILVTTTDSLIQVTDTLNTTCGSSQIFTFNADNTCTYTNFDCITQTTTGHWSLSKDQLTLSSDMVCADTTKAGKSQPFANAQVYNVGQYSLVLQTGNYNVIPTTINKTTVVRYGFIRQSTSIK